MKENVKKYLAEMIGTFVLVTFGCGVAVATGCEGPAGVAATALAFGLVIVAMAYSIGNVSGCHINPAVSLAMWIDKKLSGKDFVGYVLGQLVGATLGCLMLLLVFGKDCGFGANQAQAAITGLYGTAAMQYVAALAVEIVLTFTFVIAILGVTSKSGYTSSAGLVIGGTLTLVHLLGIYLTGTSVNPARSLLPALFAGGAAFSQVWIFLVGPLAGAALAAVVYRLISSKRTQAQAIDEAEALDSDK